MKQIKINKTLLKKVIGLSKINVSQKEEEKLLKDFANIIKEFERLQEINFPMKNDRVIFHQVINQFSQKQKLEVEEKKIINAFPQKKDGNPYVPPILGDTK